MVFMDNYIFYWAFLIIGNWKNSFLFIDGKQPRITAMMNWLWNFSNVQFPFFDGTLPYGNRNSSLSLPKWRHDGFWNPLETEQSDGLVTVSILTPAHGLVGLSGSAVGKKAIPEIPPFKVVFLGKSNVSVFYIKGQCKNSSQDCSLEEAGLKLQRPRLTLSSFCKTLNKPILRTSQW